MTIPAEVRGKFYALRALALVLGAFAVATFVLRPNSFGIRSLGLLGIMVGLWLVRQSNAFVRRARGQVVDGWPAAKSVKRVGPLAWTLTALSLVACGVGYHLMYLDALRGYKEVWPVNVFLAAVLALVITSGYVAMKIFR